MRRRRRRRRERRRTTLQDHVESNVDVAGVGERMLDCTLNLKNYHYYSHFIGEIK